jgi:hypothetical protein
MTANDPRARPTLFAPLVGIPAFLIFFVGGIAFALHQQHAAENVKPFTTPVAWLADATQVPNGTFVEIEGTFVSTGEEKVVLAGADDVMVHLASPVKLNEPTRVRGRVCDLDRAPMCGAKRVDEGQSLAAARFHRVLAVGMTPDDVRASATKGWISAGIAVVVYVAFVLFSRRRRKGVARVAEERTWTLPYGAEDIPARVRKLEDEDRFLVVDTASGRLVFIQGYSENAARGWGIRKADVFPRRATLTWRSSPREPTQVTARVEEDLLWWPASLTPTMDRLARESIASTMTGIERALGVR